jgi:glycerophosphoryl diester phosphodiesterase
LLNPPKLIGHRGVKNLSPENTLSSIELAHALGLEWVEVDIKISQDLIPFLIHDDTLDRTTNGEGPPTNFNYSEIKKLDAGIFFYKHPTKIYMPTLHEVLIFCEKNNMGLNIELKPNLGFEKKNVTAIAKLLSSFNFTNQYYFSSFDWNSLVLMKELLPSAYYGLLIHDFENNIFLSNALEICKKYNFSCCGFNQEIINTDIINEVNMEGLITTIYSEKNLKPNEANELWSKGVKSIFIDDPSEFKIS